MRRDPYPPEVLSFLDSLEEARRRLRREIERTKQLLRRTEEYARQIGGGKGVPLSLVLHLPK